MGTNTGAQEEALALVTELSELIGQASALNELIGVMILTEPIATAMAARRTLARIDA